MFYELVQPAFYISLILLSIISLWALVVNVKKKSLLLFLLVPLMLTVATASYYTLEGVKGQPSANVPNTEVRIHWYLVDEPRFIYFWVTEKNQPIPTAYVVPYTKKLHTQLAGKREKMKHGVRIGGKLRAISSSRPVSEITEQIDDSEVYELPNFDNIQK